MWFLLLVGAAIADLATTSLGIQRFGISGEMNPMAQFAYGSGGILGIVAMKGAVVGLISFHQGATKFATWLWTIAAALNLWVLV